MVELTLKNGSKLQIKSLRVKGVIIDSNGTPIGGETVFVYIESEVDALNAAVPLQQIYDAITAPENSTESEENENA